MTGIWIPKPDETASGFLQGKVGQYVVLNVVIESQPTSVCINIKKDGRAAGRRKEKNKAITLLPKQPFFSVTSNSICLSYAMVNLLAANFHSIYDALTTAVGERAIGTIERDGPEMGQVLASLEAKSDEIRSILLALDTDINTPSLALYKEAGKNSSHLLRPGNELGKNVALAAFMASRRIYEDLPELRGCGTSNDTRSQDRPNMRGALLRHFMQHRPTNPLTCSNQLDYVNYELKPLNIAGLNWNCKTNPRTDSLDLLLRFQGLPVFTEVKMAGDGFLSTAFVQLLYYSAIMANKRQLTRLLREFSVLTGENIWLCLIAEERDERRPNESGFSSDKDSTLAFLKHETTKTLLKDHFCGVFVLVVREEVEPFCRTRDIPAFCVVEEHRVDWRSS